MTSQQQHRPEEEEVLHNTQRTELAECRGAGTNKEHRQPAEASSEEQNEEPSGQLL